MAEKGNQIDKPEAFEGDFTNMLAANESRASKNDSAASFAKRSKSGIMTNIPSVPTEDGEKDKKGKSKSAGKEKSSTEKKWPKNHGQL